VCAAALSALPCIIAKTLDLDQRVTFGKAGASTWMVTAASLGVPTYTSNSSALPRHVKRFRPALAVGNWHSSQVWTACHGPASMLYLHQRC